MQAPYSRIARRVLPGWDISLAFVDARTARALNKKLRKKDYVPNVLSYQVGAKHGEVIICKAVARKQAPAYRLPLAAFLLYLFIHALLHLKGGVHGATMERRESRLLAEYAKVTTRSFTHVTTHRNRHRHRHLPGEARRRRRNDR